MGRIFTTITTPINISLIGSDIDAFDGKILNKQKNGRASPLKDTINFTIFIYLLRNNNTYEPKNLIRFRIMNSAFT